MDEKATNGTSRPKRRLRSEWVISAATVAAILLFWQLVSTSGWVPSYFTPTPRRTWMTFLDILANGYRGRSLFVHLGASLGRVLSAFVGAVLFGIPLGLWIGANRKAAAVFNPLIEFYRPLPPLAYYTLLVIWLGIENASKIALLFLAALPPIVIAAASGVRGVRADYINGALSLGASRWQMFRFVIFPASLPEIFTGLRVSIGFTYTTLVAAEMVAGVNGIGWMVLDASKFLQSDVIFVGIILMGLSGVFLDWMARSLEQVFVPWRGKG